MTVGGGRAAAVPDWLDGLPIGLAVFAPDSRLLYANPRFFALLRLHEPAPRLAGLEELLDTLRRTGTAGREAAALLAAQFLPGPPDKAPARWVRDDAVIDIASAGLPDGGRSVVLSDAGALARTECDAHRQAEREALRAKQAAEAASQAKSRFLAAMSHELRTPLNAVIGFSEAMLREADNPSPQRVAEFARQIAESGHNLLGLINVVLDVSSVESGRFELNSEPVDVVRLLRSAVRQADAAAQAAELSLLTELRRPLPVVRGDERRLLQVLNHLLSNAVKFTEAGGTITLGARREKDGGLLIFVSDTGVGIAPDDLERVFDPFTRADAAPSGRFQGGGLGLYVSRALVEGHGGRLSLRSQMGQGTTAEIRLPPG